MTVPPGLLERARALRIGQTDAEGLLWSLLRHRSLCGYKFRRQHVCDGYILDFYCREAALVVELDGGGHVEPGQADYDRERSCVLEGAGMMVIRFWNHDVLTKTEEVLEEIVRVLLERKDSPSPGAARHPLPGGEG